MAPTSLPSRPVAPRTSPLQYLSIAPQANLVIVRAFDGQGGGRYVDVIAGLNWIIANQHKYNIRVVNLSFGSRPGVLLLG